MAYNNPDIFSKLSTSISGATADSDADHLQDGVDAIHGGLLKALNCFKQDCYVSYGFNITQTTSGGYTRITLAAGGYFQDGVFYTHAGGNADMSATTGGAGSNADWYGMICISAGSTLSGVGGESQADLVIRGTSALGSSSTAKGGSPKNGDVPIVMFKVEQGSANDAARDIQYLTTRAVSKSLSVGYDNSGAYAETAKVVGASGGTTVTNSVGDFIVDNTDVNDQIVMRLGTDTSATGFEVRNDSDAVKLSVDGAGDAAISGDLTVSGDIIGPTDGDLLIKSDGNITFRIDADNDETSQAFAFQNNASTEIASLTEGGDLQIDGDLTVTGGDIIGPANGTLTIKADTDLIFQIDADSDGAETFQFKNGGGTEVMELTETGNLQIDGDLTITGGNITNALTCDSDLSIVGQTYTAAQRKTARTFTNELAPHIFGNEDFIQAVGNPYAPITQNVYLSPETTSSAFPVAAASTNLKATITTNLGGGGIGTGTGIPLYGVYNLADPATVGTLMVNFKNMDTTIHALIFSIVGGAPLPMNGGFPHGHAEAGLALYGPGGSVGTLVGYPGLSALADVIHLAPGESVTLQAITEESKLPFLVSAGLENSKTWMIVTN